MMWRFRRVVLGRAEQPGRLPGHFEAVGFPREGRSLQRGAGTLS
jgi:hypothetical protein